MVWCGIRCVTTGLHVWSDKFQCRFSKGTPPHAPAQLHSFQTCNCQKHKCENSQAPHRIRFWNSKVALSCSQDTAPQGPWDIRVHVFVCIRGYTFNIGTKPNTWNVRRHIHKTAKVWISKTKKPVLSAMSSNNCICRWWNSLVYHAKDVCMNHVPV